MRFVCDFYGASFVSLYERFQKSDLRLWSSRDGVHISSSLGIPLLLSVLKETEVGFVAQIDGCDHVQIGDGGSWKMVHQNVRQPCFIVAGFYYGYLTYLFY